jgi:predicted HTH transcriptional regulator
MTLDELKRIVSLGEGQHLEFKRRVPRPERLAKEIVAFANTQGGRLLLGVDDDGLISGVKDVHEEIFLLEKALETHCDPAIGFRIHALPVSRRREVVVIDVPDSSSKPHFLVHTGNDDRPTAYVRVSDRSIEASREVVRMMRWKRKPTDTHFEFGPTEQLLMRYLDSYHHITVSQFARVAHVTRKNASWKLLLLTRAGILHLHPDEREDYFTLSGRAMRTE